MKRLLTVLLAAVLLTALCGCGQNDAGPASKPSQQSASQPQASDIVKTGEEAENWDGLNEFGLPDLSGYTTEELWDMYEHPENWDSDTLDQCDSDIGPDEEEPYSDSETDADYVFDLGEWHDYDPGDWAPGPEQFFDYDDADQAPADDYDSEDTDASLYSEIPEKYAFLLPDGMRNGDTAMEEDGTFVLSLQDRGSDDFKAMVKRLKDAGYTKDANEMDIMGISMYEAGNGSETVTIMLQNGAILASFE